MDPILGHFGVNLGPDSGSLLRPLLDSILGHFWDAFWAPVLGCSYQGFGGEIGSFLGPFFDPFRAPVLGCIQGGLLEAGRGARQIAGLAWLAGTAKSCNSAYFAYFGGEIGVFGVLAVLAILPILEAK